MISLLMHTHTYTERGLAQQTEFHAVEPQNQLNHFIQLPYSYIVHAHVDRWRAFNWNCQNALCSIYMCAHELITRPLPFVTVHIFLDGSDHARSRSEQEEFRFIVITPNKEGKKWMIVITLFRGSVHCVNSITLLSLSRSSHISACARSNFPSLTQTCARAHTFNWNTTQAPFNECFAICEWNNRPMKRDLLHNCVYASYNVSSAVSNRQ